MRVAVVSQPVSRPGWEAKANSNGHQVRAGKRAVVEQLIQACDDDLAYLRRAYENAKAEVEKRRAGYMLRLDEL